ncbi:Transcription elongation protein [Sodalis praecaptivus]|uniref:Transcription elongation protein n=1 Tax=Sodalis praecaptivus TaxID=1239307 RepID=W0HVZ9_9GAMM|nr:hypothetical protein [Sodalis praecaptivus]AHF77929.1 Transcription elongation protein [Sodalis praecaptivus]
MKNSRIVFEEWYRDETGWSVKDAPDHDVTEALWIAWQASRAAIEIDTGYLLGNGENDTEWDEGYNAGINAAGKVIRAAGLKVKDGS